MGTCSHKQAFVLFFSPNLYHLSGAKLFHRASKWGMGTNPEAHRVGTCQGSLVYGKQG